MIHPSTSVAAPVAHVRSDATPMRMKNSHGSFWGLCFLLGACGASDDDALAVSEAAATVASSGIYTVPVSNPSMASQASHPVSVKVQRYDGEVRIHYDLPAELVGNDTTSVDMEGPDTGATLNLVGPMGTASCQVTAGAISCNEHLKPMSIDVDGVKRTAVADALSIPETAKRVALAIQFGMDPIGVMTSKRGGRGRKNR
jgi:hypothetical protein